MKSLLRQFFVSSRQTEHELRIERSLMGRALIFHGCMTFLRVFQLFTGTGVWFEDKKLCEPDVDDVCSKDCL